MMMFAAGLVWVVLPVLVALEITLAIVDALSGAA